MIHTQLLIVGRGIAGTLLANEWLKLGNECIILDNAQKNNSSLVAAAVINPLIGKNWTLAHDAANNIEVAKACYFELEQQLDCSIFQEKSIWVFHQDEKAAANFELQICQGNTFLHQNTSASKEAWNYDFGVGNVAPVFTINAPTLLDGWKRRHENLIVEDAFGFEQLKFDGRHFTYKDIKTEKIVFCEGAIGRNNPYFEKLPFTNNRGDALLLHIPDLSEAHIYHKQLRLVPFQNQLFWYGSNYVWQYPNLLPDEDWRQQALNELKHWLRLKFSVEQHLVAERPTTAGQKNLLLQHHQFPNMFLFNGLGTRGFSAGPALAKKMCELIANV